MEMKADDVRKASVEHCRVQNLMYRVNERTLFSAHRAQPRNKALGVDGISKTQYEQDISVNLANLVERMKKFSYKPMPVRRTYIPKANGKLRPLGIPSYEDRLVQSVMTDILNEVYEPRFLDCSYGFRPHKRAHEAIKIIQNDIMHKGVNWVLEADIKGFFDNLSHEWLMKFLEHDIDDKNFLRYIKRFLVGGVMEGTEILPSDKGSVQGGIISPVLANVYLHYVLDLWVTKVVKPNLRGYCRYVRFADDFIFLLENESDARRIMNVLGKRLGKFSLELAEDKTRILPFGPIHGGKENFDFLGFTFVNAKARRGFYRVAVITSKKKLKAKREALKTWLREQLISGHVAEILHKLSIKLKGHYNYYGISGNSKKMSSFYHYATHATFRMVNRRSQKKSFTMEKFLKLWYCLVAKPRITYDIWH